MKTPKQPDKQPEKGKRRVFVVDDHLVLREGLAMVINQQPDLLVCGEAADAPQALQTIDVMHPDIVLVDLSLATGSGLELVKDLHAVQPDLPILVLSLHDEALYAERVLRAGARGYVMKRSSIDELLAAMRKVLAGEIYVSEKMAALLVGQTFGTRAAPLSPRPSVELLSDRELEVFQLLGAGHGTNEIARQLGLSMKTVSCYRQNIKTKLHLKDATELVQHAVHWNANLRA